MSVMLTMLLTGLLLASLTAIAEGHGFLAGVGRVSGGDQIQVREAYHLGTNIDRLRNPIENHPEYCRGAKRGAVHKVSSIVKDPYITQAISLGAQHTGPCTITVRTPTGDKHLYKHMHNDNQCTLPDGATKTESSGSSGASGQCKGMLARYKDYTAPDMCLQHLRLTASTSALNVVDRECSRGVVCTMEWVWAATHLRNPPNNKPHNKVDEHYRSCVDFTVLTP